MPFGSNTETSDDPARPAGGTNFDSEFWLCQILCPTGRVTLEAYAIGAIKFFGEEDLKVFCHTGIDLLIYKAHGNVGSVVPMTAILRDKCHFRVHRFGV